MLTVHEPRRVVEPAAPIERPAPPSPSAREWLGDAFADTAYRPELVEQLIRWARPGSGLTWESRCLAALVLQEHVLRIPSEDHDELGRFLSQLGLLQPAGFEVDASLLREGYTSTQLGTFAREFRRKLGRPAALFERIRQNPQDPQALGDFLDLAKHECKLVLARYLFSAEEVVERILAQVRTSAGQPNAFCEEEDGVAREIRRTFSILPSFEAAILRRLVASPRILWVAEATSARVNSLVEYPLRTVVLVVKPPGSELEIEIKRVGRPHPRPLGVVFRRDGELVANMHRLDGGSSLHFLKDDAAAASRLAQIYRPVHGREAPVSRTLAIKGIAKVPVPGGEACLFEYFAEPNVPRGERAAMTESIQAFEREWGSEVSELPGQLGLTVQFLTQIPPGQAVLTNTTSFRLDLLAGFLGPDGPDRYFGQGGLAVPYTKIDERRFADALMEEVLGTYDPPEVPYETYAQYVEAGFAVEANRRRGRRAYLEAMEEIGRFWATLLAVRGYSRGESFVARNIGLRSVWEQGRFRVRIYFMDHDSLRVPQGFDAPAVLAGTAVDERFLFGSDQAKTPRHGKGSVVYLAEIYRASPALAEEGHRALRQAMKDAYRKVHGLLEHDEALRRRFARSHLETSYVFDQLVAGHLELADDKSKLAAWRKSVLKTLKEHGFKKKTVTLYFQTIEKHNELLRKVDFLFPRLPAGAEGEEAGHGAEP